MKKIVLIALLLGACTKPHIDDPRVEYPLPPAQLMETPKELKTIQTPKEEPKP